MNERMSGLEDRIMRLVTEKSELENEVKKLYEQSKEDRSAIENWNSKKLDLKRTRLK